MRNLDPSTLLFTIIDEIARQEKISNDTETILAIYPSFYNKEARLFNRINVDDLIGLLYNLKILKVASGKHPLLI